MCTDSNQEATTSGQASPGNGEAEVEMEPARSTPTMYDPVRDAADAN